MSKRSSQDVERGNSEAELRRGLARADEDLDIMDRYAEDLAMADYEVQEAMRKRDREYKDGHLCSVPRSMKHRR